VYPCRKAIRHPASPLLVQYATSGCSAQCGPNWTTTQIEDYIKYNNHTSARQPKAAATVRSEALQKVQDGLCKLVNWEELKKNVPPKLKVAPLVAVPHKSRDFRMILDLSFQLNYQILDFTTQSTPRTAPKMSHITAKPNSETSSHASCGQWLGPKEPNHSYLPKWISKTSFGGCEYETAIPGISPMSYQKSIQRNLLN
jgi:hypothetical protein